MSTELQGAVGVRTENDAVIQLARTSAEPVTLEVGEIAVFRTPDGIETVDLDAEEYEDRLPRPRRKDGTVVVHDVASFATYYAKHSDANTEVYANLDAGTVTAVLDAHQKDAPRWEQHVLELRLTKTQQWRRWTEKDRTLLPQIMFAEHIEDNLVDIDPNPVPAATMLEVATKFQTATKGRFVSGTTLASGARQIIFEEETTASSGTGRETIPVPEKFAVRLAPFDDTDLYRIEARLRYRIEGGALKLCFVLDRPEDSLRDAVKDIVAQVAEATKATIMRGSPA